MSIDAILNYNPWTNLKVNSMSSKMVSTLEDAPAIVINVGSTQTFTAQQILGSSVILFAGGGLASQVSRANLPSGSSITLYVQQDITKYVSFEIEFAVDTTPGIRTIFVPPDIVNVIPSFTESTWTNSPTPSTVTFQRGNIVLTLVWIPSILKWALFGLGL